MAELAPALIVEALTRAASAPEGIPLHSGKAGLFATSAAAKSAALRCKEDGLLQVVRKETKGRSTLEICTLSEKGFAYLLQQTSPRSVLEALAQALQTRQLCLENSLSQIQNSKQDLIALRALIERVLAQLTQPSTPIAVSEKNGKPAFDLGQAIRSRLTQWHEAGALDDFPLPELYRRLRSDASDLTIGQFHDQLRQMHQAEQVFLHPWTGPLYELPEPSFALLVGHQIAYYVSRRG